MLPHLRNGCCTCTAIPKASTGPVLAEGVPGAQARVGATVGVWSDDKQQEICYCVLNEVAALLWAVDLGSLEIHTSLHTQVDLHRPTWLVFDLDPGEGVDVLGCAEVALRLRDVLHGMGLHSCVKTSGSKGLQVYVPMDRTYAETKPLARAVAEGLERTWPERVTSRVQRSLRAGKVLDRLGPEHRAQVDGGRVLGPGEAAPHGVDAAHLG